MDDFTIYQIKATLKDARPPIWRRFLTRDDVTLYELHLTLQILFGWENSHIYQFLSYGTRYSDANTAAEMAPEWSIENGESVLLRDMAPPEGGRFIYFYDFLGDSWDHDLLIEKVLPPEPGEQYPFCLKGKRAGPPEDIGGPGGFAYFLDALQDPDDPDREMLLAWRAGQYDPEAFDLAAVNRELRDMEWVSTLLRRARAFPAAPADDDAPPPSP